MSGSLHELVGVPVTGDDHDLVALGRKAGGERRDHVVGLVAFGIDGGDPEGLDEAADELDLLDERLRRLGSAGLVARGEGVAKSRLSPVERDGHPCR